MRWQKIIEQFKDEWILVDVKEVDENFNLIEGEVLAHSKDKEELYRKLLEIRPKKFSIEFTGKIPEELALVLFYENI